MRRLVQGVVTTFLVASTTFLTVTSARAAPAGDDKTKVEISSGTVAVGAGRKEVTFTVTNLGDEPLADPVLAFDRDSWDADQVRLVFDDVVCETGADTVECALNPDPLAPGRFAKLTVGLEVGAEATPGPGGTLVVHTRNEGGDAETFEFALTVSGDRGPDLFVRAVDVPEGGGTVEPGRSAHARYYFGNHGDVPAKNVHVRVDLPEGAEIDIFMLTENVPLFLYCFASRDRRSATCEWPGRVLAPQEMRSAYFPIVVNADAEPGVDLTGTMTITGEAATQEELAAAKQANAAAAAEVPEIDDADNTDRFQIFVAPAEPAPPADGGTGGGDGEPGLPVTGPVAASAAGIGVGFLMLGGLLVFASRRRRV